LRETREPVPKREATARRRGEMKIGEKWTSMVHNLQIMVAPTAVGRLRSCLEWHSIKG